MVSPTRFLVAIALLSATMLLAFDASAQGTCQCNMGCHSMPGQCLISGTGCNAGYAPFCDYRPSGTCPQIGDVSCSGSCTCVSINPMDAGADVITPPDVVDVPPPDSPVMDVPPPDSPVSDVPPPDSPVMDVPPPDVPGMDVQPDVNPCPVGIYIDGVCYDHPCSYDPELGFVCPLGHGYFCQLSGGQAFCVTNCATPCMPGFYCDPTAGCRAMDAGTANCSTLMCIAPQTCDPILGCVNRTCNGMMCPAGTQCVNNVCTGPGLDGGVDGGGGGDGGMSGDAGHAGDGSGDGGNTGRHGSCGCRVPGTPTNGTGGAIVLALAIGMLARRRKRNQD